MKTGVDQIEQSGSIGAPFDAKAENVKEIMLQTVHPYTKYELYAAKYLDRKLPAGTKGFWVRFDKSTSTYPTTVHGSSEKYVIENVAAVVSKDGKQQDFKRPKAVVLFGGPGSDAWTSEYYVKGNFFHSTFTVEYWMKMIMPQKSIHLGFMVSNYI